jgi:hypothetical protein
MLVVPVGKSIAIRFETPVISMASGFESQIDKVERALDKALRLLMMKDEIRKRIEASTL